MIGSPLIGAFIARAAFWCLIAWGLTTRELELKGTVIFLGLWIAGYVGFGYLPIPYSGMFPSFVAILDVVLVLLLFKGDIRIT